MALQTDAQRATELQKRAGRMPALQGKRRTKNGVAIVAKYLCARRVGLGVQAGMPVLLEGLPWEGNFKFKIVDLKCGLTARQKSRPREFGRDADRAGDALRASG